MLLSTMTLSFALVPVLIQDKPIASWPKNSPNDVPNSVFIVHELKGSATIVRSGKTYQIASFKCADRMESKLHPYRLLILNNDEFWLGENAFAKISFPKNDGSCLASDTLEIGKDYRKPRIQLKNYGALSQTAIAQIRKLVNFGGNDKPLEVKLDPQILWPRKDEVVPANQINIRLWKKDSDAWGEARISYILAVGELEIWSGSPMSPSTLSIDRALLMNKLKSQFGTIEHWVNKPIPLRFYVKQGSQELYQDFFLASPDREKQISDGISNLKRALSERSSYEREIKLTQLCSELNDCPSLLVENILPKRKDKSLEAILAVLCEEHQIPLELLSK